MRVLIIGGDFWNETYVTGYMNAVKDLVAESAKINEVVVISADACTPSLMKDKVWKGAKILSKRPCLAILVSTILHMPYAIQRVKQYTHMYDGAGLLTKTNWIVKFSVLYAFNRAFFERAFHKTEPNAVHVHGVTIQTLPYHDALLEMDLPYLTTAHGLYSEDPNIETNFDKSIEGDLLREIDRRSLIMTAVSIKVKEEAIKRFSLHEENVKVVHNGAAVSIPLDIDRSELRRRHGVPQGRFVLLTVGTVGKRKNQEALLEAMAAMPREVLSKTYLFVVGDGDITHLKSDAERLGITRFVTMTGRVNDTTLQEMYHIADAFVLTSTSEGFPLVFLEAMAAGLPILTYSDLEAVGEIFDPDCVIAVGERSPMALSEAIVCAMGRRWNKALILDRAARWNWEKVVDEYQGLYIDLNR